MRKHLGLAVLSASLAIGATYLLIGSASKAVCTLPACPREIPLGAPLPPLVLTDDHGKSVALRSLPGAPTMLLFFRATSCPICRKQLAAFAQAADQFRAAEIDDAIGALGRRA